MAGVALIPQPRFGIMGSRKSEYQAWNKHSKRTDQCDYFKSVHDTLLKYMKNLLFIMTGKAERATYVAYNKHWPKVNIIIISMRIVAGCTLDFMIRAVKFNP